MATINENTYTQTKVETPTKPSTTSVFDIDLMAPLIREIVKDGLVEEPKLSQDLTSANSFFSGDTLFDTRMLQGDIKLGQEFRVNILKDQNPLSLFQKDKIEYKAVDNCHDQIVLDCTVPCINTLPTFNYVIVRYDTEYAYGVRACDKNKDFYDMDFYTKQYALSREAEQFGRELDLWNAVIRGLIAAPATTVDVALAAKHATHYWNNQGDVATNARALITEADWYLRTNFSDVNPTVFMTDEAAKALIASVENPYNLNRSQTIVNTFEQWNVPGFMVSSAVKDILGTVNSVVIMKRSPWLTTGATGALKTQFPLWNADATKQYVAVLDPRVGYQFSRPGYSLNIKPYDCDHLTTGLIDTEYVGSGITFPQYGLIIEFDPFVYA